MVQNDDSGNIAFVILAAGESNRMGDIKQLLQWQNKSFIDHIIDKSIDSNASKTFVVLGASAEKIQNTIIEKPVQAIFNPNWKKGLGTSVSEATKYILKLKEAFSGILFSLVDQPLITTLHFNNLINNYLSGDSGIIATSFEDSFGVPVIFSSKYFNTLLQLDGSGGAKSIIQSNRSDTSFVSCTDSTIDIDTPEDYMSFLEDHS